MLDHVARRLAAARGHLSAGRLGFPVAAFGLAAGLAVLLLSLAELALRNWWPQTLQVVATDLSSTQKPLPARPLPPYARFVVEGPEFSLEYHTDNRGFRTAGTSIPSTEPRAKRLLLLGDSFTFGSGVDYRATWPTEFQEALREDGLALQVINAGLPGQDTRSEVVLLEQLLLSERPDLVLLVFLPNDLFTNRPLELGATFSPATSRRSPTRVSTRDDKRSSFDVVTLTKRLLLAFDRSYVALYSMGARREYFTVPLSGHCRTQLKVTKGLLAAAASLCRQADVPFAVLSLPQQFQVLVEAGGLAAADVDVGHIDRSLGEFAAQQGFPWLSAHHAFVGEYRRQGEDLYYRLDGHLNVAGSAFVARWLADRFSRDLAHAL